MESARSSTNSRILRTEFSGASITWAYRAGVRHRRLQTLIFRRSPSHPRYLSDDWVRIPLRQNQRPARERGCDRCRAFGSLQPQVVALATSNDREPCGLSRWPLGQGWPKQIAQRTGSSASSSAEASPVPAQAKSRRFGLASRIAWPSAVRFRKLPIQTAFEPLQALSAQVPLVVVAAIRFSATTSRVISRGELPKSNSVPPLISAMMR